MFKRNKQRDAIVTENESRMMLGDHLSFAASEAYKLLRTNVLFSLPGEQKCRIIGVTSALRGEGKSTTSMNLAYSVAQTGKNVLLLEADMRLATVAKRLELEPSPGLSNLLVGLCTGDDTLQKSGLLDTLYVITAGDVPPNPSELLGSEQMKEALQVLSRGFDFIIVDLPPVNVVTDALIVSKLVDGMVIVVRQDYCDRQSLNEVVRQLQFAETKILGFVLTNSDVHQKGYKRYGKYGKYGRYGRYGGKYGKDYGYGEEYGQNRAQSPLEKASGRKTGNRMSVIEDD